jgi:hypothetical protein
MTERDHCGWEAVKVNFEYTAAEDYDGLGCNFAAQDAPSVDRYKREMAKLSAAL